ncbi:MAG: pyruvate, phosphate dikinase [Archangium sp.]|nr:pyruvate, phosphate dikinase [Archangium sp.]MDP3575687.1 pyruvate, phosphate dikinase [Archangium sp.]
MSPKSWVYGLDELPKVQRVAREWEDVRSLLGGKGANLAEMTRLGLPVPPGFIITTEACREYLHKDAVPKTLWSQVEAALKKLEKHSGKRFGDPENPLLVACRSGAKFSMPGMMDTVLNIGLTPEVTLGLAKLTSDARFAWDSARRLVQMFGTVVMEVPDVPFEAVLTDFRARRKVENDADLSAEDLEEITLRFKTLVREHAGRPFPEEPMEQLRLATEAVFRSWKGKRARDYRKAAHIPDDLGTAVNIVAMVFGNMGAGSATGVATTRNVSTGEKVLEGDYLLNAQGEDVVAGTRATRPLSQLRVDLPEAADELAAIARKLELHYREVQDVEFTVERGTLWMLQTRDAKRTARAAVRIAVDLARERRITRKEAVMRVKPEHVDFFLHPQFDPEAVKTARAEGRVIAIGLNVSPGAATGRLTFDADEAVRLSKEKRDVIMIRAETKPDDVHGMLAAKGIITSRGGRTSHAALVARQFGKPAVVGVSALEVDEKKREAIVTLTKVVLLEGTEVSLDGNTGEVFSGRIDTRQPALEDPWLLELLQWADEFRTLSVYANADYPRDAERARALGAEGIGLCRTEHMFFETDRLPLVQRLILAKESAERDELLQKLLPMQRADFAGLFRAMDGNPVTIRLIDPPLHEFLPRRESLIHEVAQLETRVRLQDGDPRALADLLHEKQTLLLAVDTLHEENPMLGLRGVRLGIHMPELVAMQVRALFEAACDCANEGITVLPKVMIPLVAHLNELKVEQTLLVSVAREVMAERKTKVPYQFGTMIEIPRAALTADQIAGEAQFFSFGTNDLTQTTFGISRDDAESGFLTEYLEKGILTENPFTSIDEPGVGQLMQLAIKLGRKTNPKLSVGICGEHGGDPRSIAFCHRIGVDSISCSPFRIPVARLAAAHAALADTR